MTDLALRSLRQALAVAGIVALVTSGIGCVGYRSGELEDTRPWPPAQDSAAKKPAIRLSLVAKATFNQKPAVLYPTMSQGWLNLAGQTYVESGLFSDVRTGDGPADLLAEMEVLDAGSGSRFMWFITGFTLFLIPSSGTDEFTWKTTFKDGAGNVRTVIEKKESSRIWMQLLLMFGFPFSTPGSAVTHTISDLNRATLLDALEKGALKP